MSEEQGTSRKRFDLPPYFPTLVLAGSIVFSAVLLAAVSWIHVVSSSVPDYLFVPGFDEHDSEFDSLRMYQVGGTSHRVKFVDALRCYWTEEGKYRERFLNGRFHVKYESGAGLVAGIAEVAKDKCRLSKSKPLSERQLNCLTIDVAYAIRVLGVRIHRTHKVIPVRPEIHTEGSESADAEDSECPDGVVTGVVGRR